MAGQIATRMFLALFVAALAGAAQAQVPAEDWAATLKRDAHALHGIYAKDHPGGVQGEDPVFMRRLDEGLQQALERAKQTTTYAAYWFAMQEYLAGFDDAHVRLGWPPTSKGPPSPILWPGFLVRYDAGAYRVADRSEQGGLPPRGAVLKSCDRIDAETLGRERVGRFQGLWRLESQRAQYGHLVLMDQANPFAPQPRRCVFEDAVGEPLTVDLQWRPIGNAELKTKQEALVAPRPTAVGARRLADGAYWIAAGSFQNSGETQVQLRALLSGLKSQQGRLREAPFLVLDLRGNTGGASTWADQIAEVVWGRAYVAERSPPPPQLEWRVSDANIRHLESSPQGMPGLVAKLIAGRLRAAQGRGEPLWRQPTSLFGSGEGARSRTARPAYAGRVFVVTDALCVSSCLYAVEQWKALGARQVGRETSANSQYGEVRWPTLPSGHVAVSVPMKVFRTSRPPNSPHSPEHPFHGDLADDTALETFIRGLL